MIHYIALYQLGDDVDDETVEAMIRSCNSLLFRIHEVHNVRSGRKVGPDPEFPFFVAIDFENLDKLEMFREDAQAIKFQQEVVEPHTTKCLELVYETEPGKNTKYS